MRRKMEHMQAEMEDFVRHVRDELRKTNEEGWEEKLEQALVKLPPTQIVKAPAEKGS